MYLLKTLAHHAIQHPTLFHTVLEDFHRLVHNRLKRRFKFKQYIEWTFSFKWTLYVTIGQYFLHRQLTEELECSQVDFCLEGMQYWHDRIKIRYTQHHHLQVLRLTLKLDFRFSDEA